MYTIQTDTFMSPITLFSPPQTPFTPFSSSHLASFLVSRLLFLCRPSAGCHSYSVFAITTSIHTEVISAGRQGVTSIRNDVNAERGKRGSDLVKFLVGLADLN